MDFEKRIEEADDELKEYTDKEDIKYLIDLWTKREEISKSTGKIFIYVGLTTLLGIFPTIKYLPSDNLLDVLMKLGLFLALSVTAFAFFKAGYDKIDNASDQAEISSRWYDRLILKLEEETRDKIEEKE
ncbi:MAG: hypothetical protein ABEK10_03880 [Candidatus Nanosalina sp.]